MLKHFQRGGWMKRSPPPELSEAMLTLKSYRMLDIEPKRVRHEFGFWLVNTETAEIKFLICFYVENDEMLK